MNRRLIHGALAGALLLLTPALSACAGDDAPVDAADAAGAAVPSGEVAFAGGHVEADAFVLAVEQPGVIVVDVRTPAEFADGHLPGAVNIDVSGAGFAEAVAALDPDADYAVYCRSGNRSRTAIALMSDAGVERTVGLEGGIGAWTGEVVTGA